MPIITRRKVVVEKRSASFYKSVDNEIIWPMPAVTGKLAGWKRRLRWRNGRTNSKSMLR